jgi:hypothetical protein
MCAIGLSLTGLTLFACSDENTHGSNPDAQSYFESCVRLCDAQAAKACKTDVTLADCKIQCDILKPITQDCAGKYKLYGQCTDQTPDVCVAKWACGAELASAKTTCGFTF